MTAAVIRQDDPAWTAWRAQGLGASEAASICRIPGAYSSPWEVYAEKVGLTKPELDESTMELFDWGHDIEPLAVRRFHDRTGLYVVGEQLWCEHQEYPHLRATVDGLAVESPESAVKDALGTVEVKFDKSWGRWQEVPPRFQAQAQIQMAVTNTERTWFAVIHGWHFEVYEFERNQPDIDWLVGEMNRFWFDHILTGVPPDSDGSEATTRALNKAWRADNEVSGSIVHLADTVARWDSAKDEVNRAETELAKAANEIKAYMGKAGVATLAGEDGKQYPAFTWRGHERGNTDIEGLRRDHPDLMAEYTHTENVRRFLRTAPKPEKKGKT